jgi:hypothetical protein
MTKIGDSDGCAFLAMKHAPDFVTSQVVHYAPSATRSHCGTRIVNLWTTFRN